MELVHVLRDAFELLREKPILFVPRLILTGIWSIVWLELADMLGGGLPTMHDALGILVFSLALAPIQIWVYNSYIVMVKQHRNEGIDMRSGFKAGFHRLPEGIAAYFLTALVLAVALLPGIILVTFGIVQMHLGYLAFGSLLLITTFVAVSTAFYFTPAVVVLGEESFMQNVRNSLHISQSTRTDVLGIVLFTFALLIATTATRGAFETIGLAGFLFGRFISATVSLYLLIVNPEFLLELQEQKETAAIQ